MSSDRDPLDPACFGAGEPFSLGVEEELLLVDPAGRAAPERRRRAARPPRGAARGQVEREVHACQIELITDVCTDVSDAIDVLAGLRLGGARDRDRDRRLPARTRRPARARRRSPTRERYRMIRDLLGDALRHARCPAIHVHVGMPDAESAIRAQRPAAPPAAAGGARRQRAVPPRARHRARLGARDHAPGRGRARVRRGRCVDYADFTAFTRSPDRGRGRPGLHVPLVEAAPAPAAGYGGDPGARRAGLAHARRVGSWPPSTRSPATRRSPTRSRDRRRSSWRRRRSARPAPAWTREAAGRCGPAATGGRSCSRRRSTASGRAPGRSGASRSSTGCSTCWPSAAAPDCSARAAGEDGDTAAVLAMLLRPRGGG